MPPTDPPAPRADAAASLPTLEYRIAVSPNDGNMRMVRYFLESARLFGGPIARSAHCVLSIGDAAPPRDLRPEFPWMEDYSIDAHWVAPEQFATWQYNATGFDRFWIESDADVVAKLDADLLVAGDFEDMVLRAHRDRIMLGFMAHVSPFGFRNLGGETSAEGWARIFRMAGQEMPPLTFQYSAYGLDFDAMPARANNQVISNDPDHRFGPAYFNAGVVVGPRTHLETMGETIIEDIETVRGLRESIYAYQMAHPISFARHGIAHDTVSINYNFPMNLPTDAMRAVNPDPDGLNRHEDTRIFHYIGRRKYFETPQRVRMLIENDAPDGAWPVFRQKLKAVHDAIGEGKG